MAVFIPGIFRGRYRKKNFSSKRSVMRLRDDHDKANCRRENTQLSSITTDCVAVLQLFFTLPTRSSAITEEPRDALRQLKTCQLMHTTVGIKIHLKNA